MLGILDGNALTDGSDEGPSLGAFELGLSDGASLGIDNGESDATIVGRSLGDGDGTLLILYCLLLVSASIRAPSSHSS